MLFASASGPGRRCDARDAMLEDPRRFPFPRPFCPGVQVYLAPRMRGRGTLPSVSSACVVGRRFAVFSSRDLDEDVSDILWDVTRFGDVGRVGSYPRQSSSRRAVGVRASSGTLSAPLLCIVKMSILSRGNTQGIVSPMEIVLLFCVPPHAAWRLSVVTWVDSQGGTPVTHNRAVTRLGFLQLSGHTSLHFMPVFSIAASHQLSAQPTDVVVCVHQLRRTTL